MHGEHSLSADVLVILKPSVGKAVALYAPALSSVSALRKLRSAAMVDASTGRLVDPDTGEIIPPSGWSELDDAERQKLNADRCNQRAKSEMSDVMVHNRLTTMWVLTIGGEGLHGPDGRAEVMRRMGEFIRKLRKNLFRDQPFPYVYSPELHPGGHGWHVNLFLRKGFIDKRQMDRLWGHGNTWFTDFTVARTDSFGRKIGRAGRNDDGVGARPARRAAAYAAKYAAKDWSVDNIGPGAHRYERAQRFGVPEQRFRARTLADALAELYRHPAVGNVTFTWERLNGHDDWHGPNMRGICFDHRPKPARGRPSVDPAPGAGIRLDPPSTAGP